MSGLVILVSCFAAGSFARRVALKHEQFRRHAAANGPGLVPGLVQSVLSPQVAAIARANGLVGAGPQLHPHGRIPPNRSPLMSMQGGKDYEYRPNRGKDWTGNIVPDFGGANPPTDRGSAPANDELVDTLSNLFPRSDVSEQGSDIEQATVGSEARNKEQEADGEEGANPSAAESPTPEAQQTVANGDWLGEQQEEQGKEDATPPEPRQVGEAAREVSQDAGQPGGRQIDAIAKPAQAAHKEWFAEQEEKLDADPPGEGDIWASAEVAQAAYEAWRDDAIIKAAQAAHKGWLAEQEEKVEADQPGKRYIYGSVEAAQAAYEASREPGQWVGGGYIFESAEAAREAYEAWRAQHEGEVEQELEELDSNFSKVLLARQRFIGLPSFEAAQVAFGKLLLLEAFEDAWLAGLVDNEQDPDPLHVEIVSAKKRFYRALDRFRQAKILPWPERRSSDLVSSEANDADVHWLEKANDVDVQQMRGRVVPRRQPTRS